MRSTLTIGTRFSWRGDEWVVTGRSPVNGHPVCRKRGVESCETLSPRDLASDPSFAISETSVDSLALASALTELPPHLAKEGEVRLGDLLEARTGYRAGNAELAVAGEPRPQFDPSSTTLRDRYRAKAEELGCAVSTLHARWSRYSQGGLGALIDGRTRRESIPLANLHPTTRDVIVRVIERNRHAKNARPSNKTLRLEVIHALESSPDTMLLRCPPKRSFDRYVAVLQKKDATSGPTKYERSRAEGPEPPFFGVNVTRAGQLVIIDQTPANVFALDPLTLEPVMAQLLLAICAYTRSILAARFLCGAPNRVDASCLLRDLIYPRPANPDWPESLRWGYHGIPEHVVVALTGVKAPLAALPLVHPENCLTDNAWIFKSFPFRDAGRLLRINVQYARVMHPTDKAILERTFGIVDEDFFSHLPGYSGKDVHSGAVTSAAMRKASLSLVDMENEFWEWVVRYWQVRPHDGLALATAPQLDLSPNDMYEQSLLTSGFVHVPAVRDLYYLLLARELCTIGRNGIRLSHFDYDGPELDTWGMRYQRSPYGQFGGLWPVRFDPRDVSSVFVQHPRSGEWCELRVRYPRLQGLHFDSDTRDFAISLAKERGKTAPTAGQLEDYLLELIRRREAGLMGRGKEIKAARRALERARQAANDRQAPQAPSPPSVKPRQKKSKKKLVGRGQVRRHGALADAGPGEVRS